MKDIQNSPIPSQSQNSFNIPGMNSQNINGGFYQQQQAPSSQGQSMVPHGALWQGSHVMAHPHGSYPSPCTVEDTFSSTQHSVPLTDHNTADVSNVLITEVKDYTGNGFTAPENGNDPLGSSHSYAGMRGSLFM
jgi:hypothetical protein